MKENFKNYWKKNGFYMVLTGALVVVLGISGIAGYRSGMKDKAAAENAAEFSQAENAPEVLDETPAVAVGNTTDIENAVAESVAEAEAANASVAETFGDDAKMVWPVEGEILKEYSPDKTIYFETLDQYKCNPALMIKADVNQEVVGAFGGTVESVTEDSVNGTMITVDMGNGYKAVYGQMKDVNVKEGDKVVKGQAIGNVAQPTKYYTEEGSHLYFGMTKDGTPVDPQNYLGK
ncbi:peptidoglycan DD-metalloendopeptidase family protein [Frisingicoccus sp.]|uniref:peptidoglycan DD-metalloendopeptidase family protein n=1 Tax=Frisingicoccus sp. TaxID=1918627 RepID=UPI003AB12906